MADLKLDPELLYKKLMSATWGGQAPYFSNTPDETKVNLRPNKEVPKGLFKPDPLLPGGWIAHPSTIRAVRKEIFIGGEEFIDLEQKYECESCSKILDLQFWHFCPYCETSIKK